MSVSISESLSRTDNRVSRSNLRWALDFLLAIESAFATSLMASDYCCWIGGGWLTLLNGGLPPLGSRICMVSLGATSAACYLKKVAFYFREKRGLRSQLLLPLLSRYWAASDSFFLSSSSFCLRLRVALDTFLPLACVYCERSIFGPNASCRELSGTRICTPKLPPWPRGYI